MKCFAAFIAGVIFFGFPLGVYVTAFWTFWRKA